MTYGRLLYSLHLLQEYRSGHFCLDKDIKKSRQARDDVRVKAEKMQEVADAFFGEWEASLAEFNSAEMRAKSEARMNETRANYDKIFEAGTQARELFDAFIIDMEDQIRFLGNALNPTGIADLQDEARQLNARAQELYEAIEETIKVASRDSNSLVPD